MSRLYVRVSTNFYSNRKTLRLKARLGTDAFWIPPKLWAYAAENQPDGTFDGYTAEDVASLIGYPGDATSMLQALVDTRFLDENPLRIHDWQEHNDYHVKFSERAKRAAAARWSKNPITGSPSPDSSSESGNGNRKGREALQQGCSKHDSRGGGLKIAPPPRFYPSELRNKISDAEKEIEKIKDSDSHKKDGRLTNEAITYIQKLKSNIEMWKAELLEAEPPAKHKQQR